MKGEKKKKIKCEYNAVMEVKIFVNVGVKSCVKLKMGDFQN